MLTLSKILLGPVLLAQGKRVRRVALKLPEPPGDRESTVGNGPPLRLLVVGDSSAAGVGAETQDDALL
ncbi:MAG: SGNH/GDSL hydrolase family protein, partial [Bacteroidota bacterium]